MKTRSSFFVAVLLLFLLTILAAGQAASSPIDTSQNLTAAGVVPVGPNFSLVGNIARVTGKPGIAFDGTNFMLAYCQDPPSPDYTCSTVYAKRITPTGQILDPGGIPIATHGNDHVGTPSVQFDGENFLVVWVGTRGETIEIYAARLTRQGTVLDPNGKALTTGAVAKEDRVIGLAIDGTNSMVTWRSGSDRIYTARISKQANNMDGPTGILIPGTGGYYPAIAFDGTNYLVTFHSWGNNLDVFGARISQDGKVLDPGTFLIAGGPMQQDHNTSGFDGKNFWVAWVDTDPYNNPLIGRIYAARVSPEGAVLDSPAILITERARGQWAPQLACDGSGCLVVFNVEYPFVNSRIQDLYARRLTQAGVALDAQPIPVSTSFWHQFASVVGYGAGHYMVAWNDLHYDRVQYSIWAQILQSIDTPAASLPLNTPAPILPLPALGVQSTTSEWITETLPVTNYATDGFAFNANDIHLFDFESHIYRNESGWHSEVISSTNHIFAAWGRHRNDMWAGGWCRGSAHFDGIRWTPMNCTAGEPLGNQLTGYWYADETHLWASGNGGTLQWTDPSNPTWNTMHLLPAITPYDLEDIAGTGPQDGYAVGERGTVLHFDGTAWHLVSGIPTLQTLNAVWGSAPDDIFIVGDWGTILHYDGQSWTQQASGTNWHLLDVWGWGDQNVYAVGLNGTILHFDGSQWLLEDAGTSQDLMSIFGALDSPSRQLVIWASGGGAALFKKMIPVGLTFLPMLSR